MSVIDYNFDTMPSRHIGVEIPDDVTGYLIDPPLLFPPKNHADFLLASRSTISPPPRHVKAHNKPEPEGKPFRFTIGTL